MVVKNLRLKAILTATLCSAATLFFGMPAFAESVAHVSIECGKLSLAHGESTTCTISGSTNAILSNLYGVIDRSGGLTVTNIQPSSGITDSGSNVNTFSVIPPSTAGGFNIATITIKAPNTGTSGTIKITNVSFKTPGDPSSKLASDSAPVTITYKSDIKTLKSLGLSSGTLSPNFSPNVTNYNVNNFNSSSISFSGEGSTGVAKVEGLGKVDLKCGDNDHIIKVTAEDGSTNSYSIIVRRSCNANNNLRSLQLSTGSIVFKPQTTTYTVNVGNNINSFKATGYVENDKSSITYSPAQTIQLVTGTNILRVNVKSEIGDVRTYTIYVNKAGESGKDGDSSLKSLEISNGTINFNRDVYDYKVTVPYEVPNVTIKATSTSGKANVKISELNELVVGENKVAITVTAENGAVSTYTITIVRQAENAEKLNNDSSLTALIINDQYMLVDPSETSIKVTIQNVIQKVNVVAIPNQTTSTVKIVSNGDMIGDQDVVRIIVTAEDGSTTTYVLNFTFPYETATVDIQEQKPINYILIIIVAAVALVIIGILVYLALTTNNSPKTPKQGQVNQNTPQNYGRWYNN